MGEYDKDDIIRECKKPDLFMVYLFLYLILVSSCSGPSNSDMRALGEKIDKIQCAR